ncbi:AMIN-like domain-containing (lipo)protein [Micromonospora siamensis]|uniref:AMIN-like domain-containing protein n=1 Tax=Micromonospora siamensis TaxID=299152 RepID=A0A1C5IRU2_9ACTN|nr:hypothetical protein [Micromonospora siamensis]SCG60853.1 hypothetical protein GA0074704_3724 [Micromonospora siamensis]
MRIRRTLLAAALLLAALVAGGPGTASGATAYCGITWGSGAKAAGTLSGAPLVEVRAGQDTCWDRVVFEFDGPVTGYSVAYGETYTEGQGAAMSPYTAGGALISVSLRAPAYDATHLATVPYRVGDHAVNAFGYRTLRDVVFGGSFEGYTTFAVGVRAQLPFRVFVLSGPDSHSRIVLDVAHQWQA